MIEDHPRLVLNLLCRDDKSNLEVTEKKTLPMPPQVRVIGQDKVCKNSTEILPWRICTYGNCCQIKWSISCTNLLEHAAETSISSKEKPMPWANN